MVDQASQGYSYVEEGSVVPTLEASNIHFQHVMILTLFGGFFAVGAYIVLEQAPCHSSPNSEMLFLGAVAFCMLLVLSTMYVVVWKDLEPWVRLKDVIMLFVYMMQLFYDNVSPDVRTFKGPQPSLRSKAAEHLGQAIIMIMSEVDAPIRVIPSMSTGNGATPPLVRSLMPFFIFLLLLRLMLHPGGALRVVISAFQWIGVFLICMTWLLNGFRYVFKKRKKRRQLIGLIRQVLDQGSARQVLPMLHVPLLLQQISKTAEVLHFCNAATAQLGASGKAVLIDALAKNGISWHWIGRSKKRQAEVVRIFQSAMGPQMTKVKNYLDMSGDVFNLVYIMDLLSSQNQAAVFKHLEAMRPQKPRNSGKTEYCGMKVLSDIDDTLLSSGGKFPNGCDRDWPVNQCYPGVLAFYRCLDCRAASSAGTASDSSVNLHPMRSAGKAVMLMPKDYVCGPITPSDAKQVSINLPTNVQLQLPELFGAAAACSSEPSSPRSPESPRSTSSRTRSTSPQSFRSPSTRDKLVDTEPVLVRINTTDECNLIFLSARPHVHKDVAEAASYRVFWDLVRSRRAHTVPTLLPGSLWPSFKALLFARCVHRAWRSAGLKKFESFEQYARLWPEYRFTFVGDNGQADVLVAEMLMEKYVGRVAACFIHQVQPLARTLTSLDAGACLVTWASLGIHFFSTYIGAALAAKEVGLLTASDIAEVAKGALQDFEAEHLKNRFLSRSRDHPGSLLKEEPPCSENRGITASSNVHTKMQQLKDDLRRANKLLRQDGLPEVEFPQTDGDIWNSDEPIASDTLAGSDWWASWVHGGTSTRESLLSAGVETTGLSSDVELADAIHFSEASPIRAKSSPDPQASPNAGDNRGPSASRKNTV